MNLPLYAATVLLAAGAAFLVYFPAASPPARPPETAPVAPHAAAEPATSAADAPEAPLTSQTLSRNLRQAMESHRSARVAYEDILGEGPGHWDPQPRYPGAAVNCIVWVTQVIAEAYLPRGDLPSRTGVLDQLRYYNRTVSFGTRKHFLAHHLAVEPEPFVPVRDGACEPDARDRVRLDFSRFKRSHGYSCPLYREGASELSYPYVSGGKLLDCAPRLDPGVYVLFGVATEKYHRVYGKASGPLGLVHGMFLDVRSPEDVKVWHASTATKKVRGEELGAYVKRMTTSMHKGYALYRLDPTWNWRAYPPSEWKDASACEKRLSEPIR